MSKSRFSLARSLAGRIVVAIGLAIAATSATQAKDRPRAAAKPMIVAVDHWSGPYVGLVAGLAEGRTTALSTVACPPNGFLCDPVHYPENGSLLGATASGPQSGHAFTAGVAAGYQWHRDSFVYGLEGDISALPLSLSRGGSASSLNLGLVNPGPVPVVATVSATAAIDWLATLRGRLGFLASPDVLIYATGGLALTEISVGNAYTDNWVFNGGAVGNSKVRSSVAGYVVGAGAEWAIGQGWALRAEYLHVDFGAQTTSGMVTVVQVPAAQNPFTSRADLTANLFRTGLTWRF